MVNPANLIREIIHDLEDLTKSLPDAWDWVTSSELPSAWDWVTQTDLPSAWDWTTSADLPASWNWPTVTQIMAGFTSGFGDDLLTWFTNSSNLSTFVTQIMNTLKTSLSTWAGDASSMAVGFANSLDSLVSVTWKSGTVEIPAELQFLIDMTNSLYDAVAATIAQIADGTIIFIPILRIAFKLKANGSILNFKLDGKFESIVGATVTIGGASYDFDFSTITHLYKWDPFWHIRQKLIDSSIPGSENLNYYVNGVYGVGTSFTPQEDITGSKLTQFSLLVLLLREFQRAVEVLPADTQAAFKASVYSNLSLNDVVTISKVYQQAQGIDSKVDDIQAQVGASGGNTVFSVLSAINSSLQTVLDLVTVGGTSAQNDVIIAKLTAIQQDIGLKLGL
jgi:hypothetical protein